MNTDKIDNVLKKIATIALAGMFLSTLVFFLWPPAFPVVFIFGAVVMGCATVACLIYAWTE